MVVGEPERLGVPLELGLEEEGAGRKGHLGGRLSPSKAGRLEAVMNSDLSFWTRSS